MIIGIGSDIIDIRRIEACIRKYGDGFINRIFTHKEIEQAESRNDKCAYYAKRFAAKEAVSKAFGHGITAALAWRDIEILNDPKGKPYVNTPTQESTRIDISISDEYPYAQAFVVISTI